LKGARTAIAVIAVFAVFTEASLLLGAQFICSVPNKQVKVAQFSAP